ncbi:uncharacterized protein [Physcomitrium patens]|uniref:EF-hand domain-containing protein n=1 Tax=Physcomitrium patens TaxID=3218 RepID=A0A2K1JKV0_PHYPA|nr:cilia- and flagella-associated protein 251-like [Physcomitrium patens]PNR42184.1 hypothetical protein PHYPA_017013 [Physcomitrium patens]|eukprot:XP_024392586.1 cilia- and flagella-associated protein 251-like [Physcomitrella patens]
MLATMSPQRRKHCNGKGELRRKEEEEAVDEVEEEEEEHEEEDEEEEEEEEDGDREEQEITEYEKQRLKTIERNKAMLASLQLPNLAASFAEATNQSAKAGKLEVPSNARSHSSRRRSERLKAVRGKRSAVGDDSGSSDNSDFESEKSDHSPSKKNRRDREYEPTDDEAGLSESEDEADEQETEVLREGTSSVMPDGVDEDDEQYALRQALALSMGASVEAADFAVSSKKHKKRNTAKKRAAESMGLDPEDDLEDDAPSKPNKGKTKRKTQKMGNKRHYTEEEVDALFPIFDDRGRGRLTVNDLERVSTAHDFTWSTEELLDMIHLFNRNQNGVLDLEDFRNVATRCNLIISKV